MVKLVQNGVAVHFLKELLKAGSPGELIVGLRCSVMLFCKCRLIGENGNDLIHVEEIFGIRFVSDLDEFCHGILIHYVYVAFI